jgi:uncharacterized membrane protein
MAGTIVAQRPIRRSERFVYWLSRHWLLAFNVLWAVFIFLPWLAPVLMRVGATGPANGIYFVYQFFCHQLPERSFFLFGPQPMYALDQIGAVWPISDPNVQRQFTGNLAFGWKVAYSDRMVAMYTSFWVASLVFGLVRRRLRPIPLWVYFLMILPMALDGGTHFLSDLEGVSQGFRATNDWLVQLTGGTLPASFYAGDALGSFNSWMRLITGALFGVASVWLAFPYAEAAFFEVREQLDSKFGSALNGRHDGE